jgi:phage tail tape-measure protein
LSIKTSTSIGGGLLGAAIGQAILPIPFVGMFVGGVIGGYLSTIGSNKVFEFLKNKN